MINTNRMKREKELWKSDSKFYFWFEILVLLFVVSFLSTATKGNNDFVKTEVNKEIMRIYYVDATNGNDENSGIIKDEPLLTIQEAKKRVSTINNNMTGDIKVYLREGIYLLSKPLVFIADDSGTNGYQIIYQAYRDETAIVSGGIKVEEWQQYEDNIYKADVPDISGVRSLFINGVRANRAKSDNDFVGLSWWNDPEIIYSQKDGICINADMVKDFKNPSDLELRWNINWQDSYCKVEDIILAKNGQMIIKMEQPYFHWRTSSGFDKIRPGFDIPFRIENAYELMNKPGDFCQ